MPDGHDCELPRSTSRLEEWFIRAGWCRGRIRIDVDVIQDWRVVTVDQDPVGARGEWSELVVGEPEPLDLLEGVGKACCVHAETNYSYASLVLIKELTNIISL